MSTLRKKSILLLSFLFLISLHALAQGDAKASAKIDAAQIMVGDQARLFIEVQNNPQTGRLQWAAIPDSFNHLEVVEKGRIDTTKQGSLTVYRQRLLITGFDSGAFRIPAFTFSVIPNSGDAYTLQTDSFLLNVQTVAVDTTKSIKGIKGIMLVKGSWLDYLWIILGIIIFIVLAVFVAVYFIKNRKVKIVRPTGPQETLQEKTLRILSELEQQQLWQKNRVKEYYIQLTDIVRIYIEQRFRTHAMELTTDELLHKASLNKEMQPFINLLSDILHTADLAKFAKAQPTQQEHIAAMDNARLFVSTSKPVIITETIQQPNA